METIRTALRRWPILVALLVICGGVAGWFGATRPTVYSASSTLVISPIGRSNAELQAGAQYVLSRMETYSNLVHSGDVLNQASASIHGSVTSAELDKAVTATVPPGSTMITVSAELSSTSASIAASDAMTASLKAAIVQISPATAIGQPAIRVDIVQKSADATTTTPPDPSKYVIAGILLALVLSLAVAQAWPVKSSAPPPARELGPSSGSVPAPGPAT